MQNPATDLKTYMKAMCDGYINMCLSIERRYGLDGYPPEIVSTYLAAEARKPGSGNAAIDRMIEERGGECDLNEIGF